MQQFEITGKHRRLISGKSNRRTVSGSRQNGLPPYYNIAGSHPSSRMRCFFLQDMPPLLPAFPPVCAERSDSDIGSNRTKPAAVRFPPCRQKPQDSLFTLFSVLFHSFQNGFYKSMLHCVIGSKNNILCKTVLTTTKYWGIMVHRVRRGTASRGADGQNTPRRCRWLKSGSGSLTSQTLESDDPNRHGRMRQQKSERNDAEHDNRRTAKADAA